MFKELTRRTIGLIAIPFEWSSIRLRRLEQNLLPLNTPSKAIPYLLRDDPADADDLGKGFDHLAQHISSLVTTRSGGISIGLLGEWGRGKSSTVLMLRKKLEACTELECEIFVFDAWTHEDDFLRRAFLESLVEFLSVREWISFPKWSKRTDRLAGKLKERREDKWTFGTPSQIFTVVITFLSAFLLKESHVIYMQLSAFATAHPIWFLVFTICALMLPVTVAILWMLIGKVEKFKSEIYESVDTSSLDFEKEIGRAHV